MDCLPQLHIAAIHAEPGYNDNVPGIGVLCRDRNVLAGAGRFKNSVYAMSNYAALGWQPLRYGGVHVGVIGGVVDGYRRGKVSPLGGVFASWGSVHIMLIPPVNGVTPATVQFSLTLP